MKDGPSLTANIRQRIRLDLEERLPLSKHHHKRHGNAKRHQKLNDGAIDHEKARREHQPPDNIDHGQVPAPGLVEPEEEGWGLE